MEPAKHGFHLCYVENQSCFATKADCERKSRLVRFVSKKYGLRDKCITIGYSCGGAHAVNFAGFFPECVSGLFIDAPVLNFCDYPGRVPAAKCESVCEKETVIPRYLNGHHPHGFITDTQGKTEEKLNDICQLIIDKLTYFFGLLKWKETYNECSIRF